MTSFRVSSGDSVAFGRTREPMDVQDLKLYLYKRWLKFQEGKEWSLKKYYTLFPDPQHEIVIINPEEIKPCSPPTETYEEVLQKHKQLTAHTRKLIKSLTMKKSYEKRKEEGYERPPSTWHRDNAEHLNSKIQCSCGGTYTLKNKAIHMKTNKHLKSL